MNCDPLARWYRWMEYFGMGRSLEGRRLEFLPELTTARRVLILGEGDGRFLRKLLEVNKEARVDCVDSSSRMLDVARERVTTTAGAGGVRFHHADALSWTPPANSEYDLVVTHFFLDCFRAEELQVLIAKIAAATRKGASWVVSEFRQPAIGWAAWRAKIWISGLYLLFGWTTGLQVRRLPDYRPLLERAGFSLAREVTASAGMLVSQLWTNEPLP